MTITTADGVKIDTESSPYQDYLRLKEWDERRPDISDPAPYRTLGEALELERRKREQESVSGTLREPALSATRSA